MDWELRRFHGDEYSTHRGSSYNSYLVQEEKTALIDTVWTPYAEEFVDNLAAEVDLRRIDFIVANHGESDHSGALPLLLRRIPGVPVYCTANGVKSLRGHHHGDWNFHTVKTGDRLSLGSKELVFVEAPMLHWPDTMFSYLTGDNILFSKDPAVTVKLYNSSRTDKNDLIAEIFKSKAVVFGSPTVNRGVLTSVAGLLEQVRGMGFKGKKAAAFGSYGWSGESTAFLSKGLREAGFAVVDDGLKIEWNPTEEGCRRCEAYGSRLAREFASTGESTS